MSKLLQNVRIARVSTIPFFVVTQLSSQLSSLIDSGANVSVITSDDELSKNLQIIEGCTFYPVLIAREISIVTDIVTLFKLWNLFRKEKFHIVHSTTPKAGLLCAIAGKLAGIPVRVHTYTGQPWVTMNGIKKSIVKFCDKLIASFNTRSYTDSFSQRDFLIRNKIAFTHNLKVIGSGSLAGVDIERFSQNNFSQSAKEQLRHSLGINPSTKILLFVGRITKDKGIFELIDAVHHMLGAGHDVTLLVVGPFEERIEDEIRTYAQQRCANKIIFEGYQTQPEKYMAISDLLCLPSYREGFGTVVIEAAAMELPVVGTKIYGLTDAVIDGVTGFLVEPKNSVELTNALKKLISNEELRAQMGINAKKRAIKDFSSTYCNELLIQEYSDLMHSTALRHRENG